MSRCIRLAEPTRDHEPGADQAFKPHLSASSDGPARKLILAIGRAADLEPADIIHVITAATGLDDEAVRNVRMLETLYFRVSRHRCGRGESAIVVLSRIFVPGTGFASRARVDRAAEVDVLTRRSPSGATFIASQRSWAGAVKDGPKGRAQRAAQRRP